MPGVVRDGGRRRVYAADHVFWLELVHRLRLTGMSIEDLRAYARKVVEGRRARPQLIVLLTAHAERTRAIIEQQQDALRFIERKIDFYTNWIETGTRPVLPKPPKSRR
jgi:DNA-binding transcriptional MerR regulator